MGGFEDLEIWQAAHQLALAVYQITAGFPVDERYGLTAQLRRAASSVSANIAEGTGRYHRQDYLRFLYVARGSLMETKSHLYLARDLAYLSGGDETRLLEMLNSLGIQLNNTIKAIREKVASEQVRRPE